MMGVTVRTLFPQVICLFLLTMPVSAATAGYSSSPLPLPVTQALAKYHIPEDSLSVFVQDVAQAEPLLALNADIPRNPASVIKVLTTFVALDSLGPAYTWKTEAYTHGTIANGRLDGDLILKGFGDPFLVTESFWKFLRGLQDRGLKHIVGDLVIDTGYFAPPPHEPGDFDGKPSRPYNAGANALLLNFQTIGFTFVPDPKANRVRIAPEPRPATLEINNNIKYVDGKCRGRHRQIRMDISPDPLAPSVSFHGRYPGSCGESTLHRVVLAPAPLVFAVFTTQWSEMGGTLTGQLRTRATPKAARHLYTARSRPLAELLRGVNKYSNNVMARHLFLTLGAERFGPPGTVEKGRAALGEWLQDQRLDLPELFVDNGSGLSRQTRISAHSLVRLLVRAYQSPFLAEFAASLPISGVDGTLRRRFQGEPLARHLRMKTGTIDDVRAIAGYLSTRSGRTYAVAMLHNHPGIHQGSGTQVQDALLRWLFER